MGFDDLVSAALEPLMKLEFYPAKWRKEDPHGPDLHLADPRPTWRETTKYYLWRYLDTQDARLRPDVCDQVARDIAQRCLSELGPKLEVAFRAGPNNHSQPEFEHFGRELARLVQYERRQGRLAIFDPRRDFDKHVATLREFVWNLLEIGALRDSLQGDQRITKIDFDFVEFSDGTRVTRQQLHHDMRQAGQTSDRKFMANFPTAAEIEAARERRRARQAEFLPRSGPYSDDGRPLFGPGYRS
jgi:hypothetical protein